MPLLTEPPAPPFRLAAVVPLRDAGEGREGPPARDPDARAWEVPTREPFEQIPERVWGDLGLFVKYPSEEVGSLGIIQNPPLGSFP